MGRGRLEAFSDGVLAIIITIMVLELKVPHAPGLEALAPVLPQLLGYALSFVYIAIYWNNHHHMFQTVERVTGGIMWANSHLLFWLSLVPFATGWMGENHFATIPVAIYGASLLMCALAYYILAHVIIRTQGPNSRLAVAMGADWKGRLSPLIYLAAVALAFVAPWLAESLYVVAALMWLVPDRRIERIIKS